MVFGLCLIVFLVLGIEPRIGMCSTTEAVASAPGNCFNSWVFSSDRKIIGVCFFVLFFLKWGLFKKGNLKGLCLV